jgi:hypothetical protein
MRKVHDVMDTESQTIIFENWKVALSLSNWLLQCETETKNQPWSPKSEKPNRYKSIARAENSDRWCAITPLDESMPRKKLPAARSASLLPDPRARSRPLKVGLMMFLCSHLFTRKRNSWRSSSIVGIFSLIEFLCSWTSDKSSWCLWNVRNPNYGLIHLPNLEDKRIL